MEPTRVRGKIMGQIQHMLDHAVVKNRRFLDDEQLIKAEQLAVLEEIFNANVRDAETMVRTAPRQLQAAMAAVIQCVHSRSGEKGETGQVYQIYDKFCHRVGLRPLTGRAFGDMLNELDMYSLLRSHVVSRGRYGRAREITVDLPEELIGRIAEEIQRNLEV